MYAMRCDAMQFDTHPHFDNHGRRILRPYRVVILCIWMGTGQIILPSLCRVSSQFLLAVRGAI